MVEVKARYERQSMLTNSRSSQLFLFPANEALIARAAHRAWRHLIAAEFFSGQSSPLEIATL